jgi:hypothetical protein
LIAHYAPDSETDFDRETREDREHYLWEHEAKRRWGLGCRWAIGDRYVALGKACGSGDSMMAVRSRVKLGNGTRSRIRLT